MDIKTALLGAGAVLLLVRLSKRRGDGVNVTPGEGAQPLEPQGVAIGEPAPGLVTHGSALDDTMMYAGGSSTFDESAGGYVWDDEAGSGKAVPLPIIAPRHPAMPQVAGTFQGNLWDLIIGDGVPRPKPALFSRLYTRPYAVTRPNPTQALALARRQALRDEAENYL